MKDIDDINKDLMFRQVYNILNKEYGTMPTKGVIAGQAVASAIFKMLSLTKNAPFNDLDVFAEDGEYPKLYPEGDLRGDTNYTTGLSKISGASAYKIVNDGSFSVDMGSIDQTSYRIYNCDYDPANPRINYVHMAVVKSGLSFDKHAEVVNLQGMQRAKTIIKSFDINCCQAAIDLSDGTIHWTDAFKDFLYQKELKVKYFGTPMHTAIRILKKNDDIDFATLNVDEEMMKLQTARALFAEVESAKEVERQFIPGNIFSNVYKRRYEDRSEVLNKYFNIEERVISWQDIKKTFYVLNPKDHNEATIKLFRKVYSTHGKRLLGKEIEAPKLGNIMVDPIIGDFESLYLHANASSKKSKKVNEFIEKMRESYTSVSGHGSNMYRFLAMNAIVDKDFAFSGYTNEVYSMMSKFYDKHPRAIARLSRYPIETLVKCIKNMRWADNSDLGFIIGEIEENGVYAESDKIINAYIEASKESENGQFYLAQANRFRDIRDGNNKGELISIEELSSKAFKTKARSMLEIKKERMSKNNSYPIVDDELSIICDKLKFDASIKELNNEFLLYLEGEKMKHCVGGYWDSVRWGRSFIFGITIDGEDGFEHSTLEIKHAFGSTRGGLDDYPVSRVMNEEDLPAKDNGSPNESGFYIGQHRGRMNEGISEESKQIGHAILKVLVSKKYEMFKKYDDMGMIDHDNAIVNYEKAVDYLKFNELDGFEKLFIRNFSRDKHSAVPQGFVPNGFRVERRQAGFPDLYQVVNEENDNNQAALAI